MVTELNKLIMLHFKCELKLPVSEFFLMAHRNCIGPKTLFQYSKNLKTLLLLVATILLRFLGYSTPSPFVQLYVYIPKKSAVMIINKHEQYQMLITVNLNLTFNYDC